MRGEKALIVGTRSKVERDSSTNISTKHGSNVNDNSKTTTANAVKSMEHIVATIKEQFEPNICNTEATEEATASTFEITKDGSKSHGTIAEGISHEGQMYRCHDKNMVVSSVTISQARMSKLAANSAKPTDKVEAASKIISEDLRTYKPASLQDSRTGQLLDDIDARDVADPSNATAYVQDMYKNFRIKEVELRIHPNFMTRQTCINELMRGILVDWLVEVHKKFKLVPETLYLTVSIIDRFLSQEIIKRSELQLVGVSALIIAAKYEEIYAPSLDDLVYICDNAYTDKQFIEMEETMLKALNYRITIPSAHTFLIRYLKAAHANIKMVYMACYLLDGTLQSYLLLKYLPSQLAAAAVMISRKCVRRNAWSPTLLKYADYSEEEIDPIATALLHEAKLTPPSLRAVHNKYSSRRYGHVANDERVAINDGVGNV